MHLPYFLSHIHVTGPYLNKKQGRKFVTYNDTVTGTKTQKTYAKYLLENHLQRELSKEETVDHIDRNKLNDCIENFRIVDSSTHTSEDNKRSNTIEYACPMCSTRFHRTPRYSRAKSASNSAGPFCSRRCSGAYGKQVQLTGDTLPAIEGVASEYYYVAKDNT